MERVSSHEPDTGAGKAETAVPQEEESGLYKAEIVRSTNAMKEMRMTFRPLIQPKRQVAASGKVSLGNSVEQPFMELVVPKHKGNNLEIYWDHLGSSLSTQSRSKHDFVVYGVTIKLCHGVQIKVSHAEAAIDGFYKPNEDVRVTILPLNSSATAGMGPAGGLRLKEAPSPIRFNPLI